MNRVKEFRKELGISQLELAKDIGVSRQTINMIENDKYNPLAAVSGTSRAFRASGTRT